MKSLKRTLSLVLALVMVLGLFGGISMTAAASDFTDDEEIQYKEAVGVMTGIGAINGYKDESTGTSSFQPKAEISRAEAATMVTRAVIGADAAASLTGVSSSFSDVDASLDWAIPSIEYMASEGILNGPGDGTFRPRENVSGYQVLKMLLCALGYGAKEEYIGAGWEVAVAKDAARYGLIAGRAEDAKVPSNDATREEVALYCLNTIQKNQVQYISTLDIYSSTGLNSIQKDVYPTLTKTPAVEYNASTGAFQAVHVNSTGDPANTWTYKGKVIGEYPAAPAVTFTTEKKTAEVTAAIKGLTFGSVTANKNGYSNGSITSAADIAGLTGVGIEVNVYTDANGVIRAVTQTQREVAQVTAKNASTGAVTLSVISNTKVNSDGSYTISSTNELYSKVSGLAVNDVVVVIPATADSGTSYSASSIEETTKITGKVTAINKDSTGSTTVSAVVDGETYLLGAHKTAGARDIAANAKDDQNVWIDSNGYLVHAASVSAALTSDFVRVMDVYQGIPEGSKQVTSMATVAFIDGTVKDVPIAGAYAGTSPTATPAADRYASFTESNGVYTLVAATSNMKKANNSATGVNDEMAIHADGHFMALTLLDSGATSKINASDPALTINTNANSSNYFGNFYSSNVKFIYFNDTAKKIVAVKEGVQDVDLNGANYATAIIEKNSATDDTPVVTAVFLPHTALKGEAVPGQVVYIPSATVIGRKSFIKASDGTSESVPVYTAYVVGEGKLDGGIATKNGTPTTPMAGSFYTIEKDTTYTTEGAFKLGTYNVNGESQIIDQAITGGLTSTNTISAGGKNIVVNDSTTVIDTRADQTKAVVPTAAGLIDAAATYADVKISALYSNSTNVASVVYINSVGGAKVKIEIPSSVKSITVTDTSSNVYEVSTTTTTVNPGTQVTVTIKLVTKAATAGSDTLTFTATNSDGDNVSITGTADGTKMKWTNNALAVDFTTAVAVNDTCTFTFTPADGDGTITLAVTATGTHS